VNVTYRLETAIDLRDGATTQLLAGGVIAIGIVLALHPRLIGGSNASIMGAWIGIELLFAVTNALLRLV
jgi:hypothetical protein